MSKDFKNPADMFFKDVTESTPADETITEATNIDIREQLKNERLTKRVQLTIAPTAYNQAKAKAFSEGRSFNNYVNNLILKDLLK